MAGARTLHPGGRLASAQWPRHPQGHIAFRSQSPGEVAPSGLGCGGQTHSVGTISQMPASALPLGCLGLKEIQEPLVNLCTRL